MSKTLTCTEFKDTIVVLIRFRGQRLEFDEWGGLMTLGSGLEKLFSYIERPDLLIFLPAWFGFSSGQDHA
jgi:hypothetical protein